MPRSFIMGILAFTLSGCLATLQTASNPTQEPVPALKIAYSVEIPEYGIKFFEFSSNGNFLAVASHFDYVRLFNARDYTLLEEFTFPKETVTRQGRTFSVTTHLRGLGFINANTWYFVANGEKVVTHIRTIQPSQEIFRHLQVGNSDQYAFANENYLLIGDYSLINWRTGKDYSPSLGPSWSGHDDSLLTRSGSVLRSSPYHDDIFFDNPENGISVRWSPGFHVSNIRITPDEHYVITAGERGTYKIWYWPSKQEMARCGRGSLFGDVYPIPALSPDGKRLAVSEGSTVRLYTIEPFRLELEAEMPGKILDLAVTNDGKLAASDYRDDNERKHLYVWDVAVGGLIGQFDLDPKKSPNVLLAFQPGSNRLAVAQSSTVMILELPERTTGQAAQ